MNFPSNSNRNSDLHGLNLCVLANVPDHSVVIIDRLEINNKITQITALMLRK